MEILPQKGLLEFNESDVENIRKKYDLNRHGRMKEAVDILEEWVRNQNHFVRKDFSRRYLEATIVSCKGSVELAKLRVDKMCTFRTLLPQFFGDFDCMDHFKRLFSCVSVGVLPKMDQNQNRYAVSRARGQFYPSIVLELFQLILFVGEYIKVHDYLDGFVCIIDYLEVDILNLLKNINPMDLRYGISIVIEGIGCNVRGIHIISGSKSIEMLVNILKQVVSNKIKDRIHVHKSKESVHEYVPKDILPEDYGGKEKCLDEIDKEWKEVYCSEEYREYMRKMNASCTDESLRQVDVFNEQYSGMPDLFKSLLLSHKSTIYVRLRAYSHNVDPTRNGNVTYSIE